MPFSASRQPPQGGGCAAFESHIRYGKKKHGIVVDDSIFQEQIRQDERMQTELSKIIANDYMTRQGSGACEEYQRQQRYPTRGTLFAEDLSLNERSRQCALSSMTQRQHEDEIREKDHYISMLHNENERLKQLLREHNINYEGPFDEIINEANVGVAEMIETATSIEKELQNKNKWLQPPPEHNSGPRPDVPAAAGSQAGTIRAHQQAASPEAGDIRATSRDQLYEDVQENKVTKPPKKQKLERSGRQD